VGLSAGKIPHFCAWGFDTGVFFFGGGLFSAAAGRDAEGGVAGRRVCDVFPFLFAAADRG
jgi:hypothetical protein